MNDLFNKSVPAPGGAADGINDALLKPTPLLPAFASAYDHKRARAAADPIGMRRLPDDRAALNDLLLDLCCRLVAAQGVMMDGRRIVSDLQLSGTRALRLLVAYGHVHHRIRQIVGTPGEGYAWGDFDPTLLPRMAAHARRMGRCWFFNATLYGSKPPAVEAAQLLMEFVGDAGASHGRQDELSALMAVEGVGIEQVLSVVMEALSQTQPGQEALARLGKRHHQVLLPSETISRIEQGLEGVLADLRGARQAV